MKFNFHNKTYSIIIVFVLLASFVLSVIPTTVKAQLDLTGGVDENMSVLQNQVGEAQQAAVAKAALDQCMILGTPLNCGTPIECLQVQVQATKAQMLCISDAEKNNAQLKNDSQWAEYAKRVQDEAAKEKKKLALAMAFKSALSLMSQQLAKDTATWIASGGKGQQPLFITEGWGAYLKNMGDSALGDFVDQIGQRYGVDLCKSPSISLAIQTSIGGKQLRKVRCTFTQMTTNWTSAIKNPNFAFEYNNSLNAGENDLSVYLKLSGESMVAVGDKIKVGTLDVAPGGWKAVKDFAGKVLTPGDVVKDMLPTVTAKSTLAEEIFTGTLVDFVNTFAQTLIGQLLQNFKNGLFTSGSNSNKKSLLSGLTLPDISSLLNPQAQPYSEGAAGAEARFNNLKQSEYSVGGPYDILNKLMTCPEDSKNNPGPTDCVLDQVLYSYIKEKKQVWQVSDDFKNRLFVPDNANSQNYSTAITYRTVLILRKYRIVPIGWEIAANYLRDSRESITFGDLLSANNLSDSASDKLNSLYKYKGLIDPYWVLKAPEVYCRRQGYGDHNTFKDSQDGSLSRDQYCSDEQQCIKENANGACAAYGYCTEERRFWNFGTACNARDNTCQTFTNTNSQAQAQSYLANTLDYRNCDVGNAGCRWYSNLLDPISQMWRSLNTDSVVDTCFNTAGCLATTSSFILQYHQLSNYSATDNMVKMATPCSPESCTGENHCTYTDGACNFGNATCTIPYGASSCSLENCLDVIDVLSTRNGGFETAGASSFTSNLWVEDLSSMDAYTRDYRDPNKGEKNGGQDNSAGLVVKAINAPDMGDGNSEILIQKDIPLSPTSTYQFKFSARADSFAKEGGVDVQVYLGEILTVNVSLTSENIHAGWNENIRSFDSGNYATATIKIITKSGTTAVAYLDNFKLNKLLEDCQQNSVALSLPSIETSTADMYFNRNAQTCDGINEGCSQFIRTKAGLGSNLIYNGGFENATSGWDNYPTAITILGVDNGVADFAYNPGAYENYPTIEVDPGKYYIISYDAAQAKVGSTTPGRFEMVFFQKKWLSNERTVTTTETVLDTSCSDSGGGSITLFNTPQGTAMERRSCRFLVPNLAYLMSYKLFAGSTTTDQILIDNIKLEEVPYNVDTPSAYSDFNPSTMPASQSAYLKKAPDYYHCYKDAGGVWANANNINTIWKNRDASCSKFAPVCTAKEVGCELYTPLSGDPAVPGVAETLDVCPQECAGYAVYKQEETDFVSSKYTQFIADNVPKYCSASVAGCDEFTNLDNVAGGAENREYYVHFNICEKPGTNDGTYYTWEGDDTSGYQLQVFKLKKTTSTVIDFGPCTNLAYDAQGKNYCNDPSARNSDPSVDLGKGICTKDDMVINPDCREFYDADGGVSYRLLSRTITISSNCHPYRRTLTQGNNIEGATDCKSHNGFWNGNNECIYMAIPGEGQTCSVDMRGCRAYTGNAGNNVRNIISSNFDVATDTDGWLFEKDGATSTATSSNVSTFVGGHSLTNTTTTASSTLKHLVNISPNKAYTLSFWAKGNRQFSLNYAKFSSASSAENFFSVKEANNSNLSLLRPRISTDWKQYELGPVFVNWDLGSSIDQYLEFNISTSTKIYLNNIVLKEVRYDVTYLVENSWYTPFSCDNGLTDSNGQNAYVLANGNSNVCADASSPAGLDSYRCVPGNMLGCSAYRDRGGNVAYLKSFARLCRKEAVGCEKLIDTYNSDYSNGFNYNADSVTSSISVPAYSTAYLVADQSYSCPVAEMGCTAYGLPSINRYDEVIGYSTRYLKNLPFRYETDVCKFNELWCDEYTGGNSFSYFKNPHGKTCEYVKDGNGFSGNWLKQGTSDTCETTLNQTFGNGYDKSETKRQPVGIVDNAIGTENTSYNGWAGICAGSANGCSEYIDPLNVIYTAEINNPTSNSLLPKKLDFNTLYTISFGNGITSVGIECSHAGVLLVSPDNSLRTAMSGDNDDDKGRYSYPYGLTSISSKSARFYLATTTPTTQKSVLCNFDAGGTPSGGTFTKISKAGVYYALSGTVNSGSCNGKVDFKTGCVLLNDRSQIDYSVMIEPVANVFEHYPPSTSTKNRFLKNLLFDAQATYVENMPTSTVSIPVSPKSSSLTDNSANIIVFAGADRACNNWLACNTYQKSQNDTQFNFTDSDKCLGISTCSSLAENGTCDVSSNSPSATSTYVSEIDKNKTGYVMIDSKVVASGTEELLHSTINNPYDAMRQLGGTSGVVNGDFDMVFGKSSDPIGWVPGILACKKDGAQTCTELKPKLSGISWNSDLYKVVVDSKQAKSGTSYLQLNAGGIALSENIAVEAGTYYLSFWVNTTKLIGSGNTSTKEMPYAELRYLLFQSDGKALIKNGSNVYEATTIDTGVGFAGGPAWEASTALITSQGVNWKHITYEIPNIPASTTGMRIALFNVNPDATNGFDQSKLGGYSMWDDIGVNTVLDTNGELSGQLSRTCRVYPAADASSCRYNKDNTQYYGQYGYCLLKDPVFGSQQCLQWWPVDTIAGESVNDYSAFYQERMPLYYCLAKSSSSLSFTNVTFNVNAANLGDYAAGMQLVASHSGNEVKFIPFSNVPASMRTLLRYPYVYRFLYVGAYLGYSSQAGIIPPVPMVAFMKPYEVFGAVGLTPPLPFYYGNKGQRIQADKVAEASGNEPIETKLCPEGMIGCGFCANNFRTDNPTVCDPRLNFIDGNTADSSRGNMACPPTNWKDQKDSEGHEITDSEGHVRQFPVRWEECFPLTSASCGFGDGTEKAMGYVNIINSGIRWDKLFNDNESINTQLGGAQGNEGGSTRDREQIQCVPTDTRTATAEYMETSSCGATSSPQRLATCLWLFGANALPIVTLDRRYGNDGILNVGQSWFSSGLISLIWQWVVSLVQGLIARLNGALSLNADDYWGGWGVIGVYIPGTPITLAVALPAHTLEGIKNIGGTVTSLLGQLNGKGLNNPGFGWVSFKIVTDEDTSYGNSSLGDPHPGVKGDILGYAMGQSGGASTDKPVGTGVIGGIQSNGFTVDYCSKIVQVVDSGGQQKAYTSRNSPNSGYKTSSTQDWDCVTNGLYGNMWENKLGLPKVGTWLRTAFRDLTGRSSDQPNYSTSSVDRCFDHSTYCTREGIHISNNGLLEPYNYCGNYIQTLEVSSYSEATSTNARPRLRCDDSKGSDSNLGNDEFFTVLNMEGVSGDVSLGINPDYFCVQKGSLFAGGKIRKKRIYANIYHFAGYNYHTDVAPFASLIAPITGQYPPEWDSKDDVAYNQPLFYEANMDASGIGQARMGQVHEKSELQKLFAKSYGIWNWLPETNSAGEIKGRYYPADGGEDWSVPMTPCGGIGNRGDNLCFNNPEIIKADIANNTGGHSIMANSPVKLDFNVNVDPEQLPIRSYSINWGDGITTTFSGVALMGKMASSNPFTLYHYYGDSDSLGTGNITIKVRDNWDKVVTYCYCTESETGTTTANGICAPCVETQKCLSTGVCFDNRVLLMVEGKDGVFKSGEDNIIQNNVLNFNKTKTSNSADFLVVFRDWISLAPPDSSVKNNINIGMGQRATLGGDPGSWPLKDFIRMTNIQVLTSTVEFSAWTSEFAHEMGHLWLAYLSSSTLNLSDSVHSYPFHYNDCIIWGGTTTDLMSNGYNWADFSGGKFSSVPPIANNTSTKKFSNLSLYIMGLLPTSSVESIRVIKDGAEEIKCAIDSSEEEIRRTTGTIGEYSLQDIIGVYGARDPVYPAQNNFKIQVALVVSDESSITQAQADKFTEYLDAVEQYLPYAFSNKATFDFIKN